MNCYCRRGGGFGYGNIHVSGSRVVNNVIEHLSEAVMPDFKYVFRHHFEQRRDVRSPNGVLRQAWLNYVDFAPNKQWGELIALASSCAADDDETFCDEALHVLMHCLSAAIKPLARDSHDV
jgi:hypothetical protein